MSEQDITRQEKDEQRDDSILSKAVKAGRRTYFFDVRATRTDDYYLTITESRKMTNPDGTSSYNRHKIFLYKEDFNKFAHCLEEVVAFIRKEKPNDFEDYHPKHRDDQED